ncbi:MAG: FKBP-type peptidyl-prolyl cis-trans isomerase [Verrucomicrobiota bacterium]
MRRQLSILALASLLACPVIAEEDDLLSSLSSAEAELLQKGSIAYGTHFAKTLIQDKGLALDVNAFTEAFQSAATGNPSLDEATISEIFADLRDYLSDRPKWEGVQFLHINQSKDGVTTTASGLQYEVLEEAEGPKPTASDQVTVHYTGKLLNGTVFDSSVDRGEPATFPLSGVIKGWTEGLQLMPQGSKFRFYIPQNLAYGEAGSPPTIPPFSTLVFDVELLGINE